MLCSIVLCCVVRCRTFLYSIVMLNIVSYCALLYCIIYNPQTHFFRVRECVFFCRMHLDILKIYFTEINIDLTNSCINN